MTRQEKGSPLDTGNSLIEETLWARLTVITTFT